MTDWVDELAGVSKSPSVKTDAYFSPDRVFRYWLTRIWDEAKPIGCCIGVNPSTADETINDPTVRKDIGFMTRLGMGGLLKLNIGAFRSTDPVAWRKSADPIGPENTAAHILAYIKKFEPAIVIAAWGKNGNYAKAQCKAIADIIPDLLCFGRNPDGTPRHTLMLPYSSAIEAFQLEGC